MVGESEVADAACLALFQQEVEQSVIDETAFEILHATAADGVQQIVVDVVHLQFLEGSLIHLFGLVEVPEAFVLVRHLGGYEIFLTGMTAEGNAGGHFRLSAVIDGSRIKIVDAVGDGVVHFLIHHILINLAVFLRQSHHTVAQE